MASAGLVAACDDPRLLGFPLWDRQRELLGHVESGPRMHVWALGRRSGKSTLAALVGLWDCLLRPELARKVRPGERRYAVAVATNLRQSRLLVAAARSVVERSPLLAPLVESTTEDEILFSNGTAFAAFPCTSRGGRGWPISTLVMDEAAHFLDTDGNQAAEPVFRSLLPSLAQFGSDGRALVCSTPYGDDGFFADLHHRVTDGEIEDAKAARMTSAEVNPTLSPALLSAEHALDPEGFRGEYLAEFVGSGGSFIDSRRLSEAVSDRGELDRLDCDSWILGLDLGFASDPTGVAVVGRGNGRLRLGLARAWAPERATTFEGRRAVEDSILTDVAEIARHFRARVVSDQHFAPQVRDRLLREGVHVETLPLTAESKSLAFAELRGRVYDGGLELYPHEDLLRELRGLRAQFKAGRSSVVTPRTSRGHSDMAVALALAVYEQARTGLLPLSAPYVGVSDLSDLEIAMGATADLFDPITAEPYPL